MPVQPVDVSGLIAQGCPGNVGQKGSSFVITGRGGKAPTPFDPLEVSNLPRMADPPARQTKPINNRELLPSSKIKSLLEEEPISLVEADSWHYDSQGNVVLASSEITARSLPSLDCQVFDHTDK